MTILNDNVYEVLEEFTAELTTTDSGVDIFQPDATAQIDDDDSNLFCSYKFQFTCFISSLLFLQLSLFSSTPPRTL